MTLDDLKAKIDELGRTIYEIEHYYGDDFHGKSLAHTIRILLTELFQYVQNEEDEHERKRKNAEKQRRHRDRQRSVRKPDILN